MRLWTLHPCYLDAKGLVAAWREGLLAQKVLQGMTRGYVNHPQLIRFRESEDPLGFIGVYLAELGREALRREYSFDVGKIVRTEEGQGCILVPSGQIDYEFALLEWKLETRDRMRAALMRNIRETDDIRLNCAFKAGEGGIAPWEKTIDDVVTRLRRR